MVWKWFGNGLEMVWKWFGNGLEMVWKWFGNGLGMVWEWFGNIYMCVYAYSRTNTDPIWALLGSPGLS
jgi:hypothetical protein